MFFSHHSYGENGRLTGVGGRASVGMREKGRKCFGKTQRQRSKSIQNHMWSTEYFGNIQMICRDNYTRLLEEDVKLGAVRLPEYVCDHKRHHTFFLICQ